MQFISTLLKAKFSRWRHQKIVDLRERYALRRGVLKAGIRIHCLLLKAVSISVDIHVFITGVTL